MSHLRQDLLEWAKEGHIPRDKLRRALSIAGVLPGSAEWRSFVDRMLLWCGAVMLAAGAIFFLAYNWHALGRYAKFALAEGLVLAALVLVWWRGLASLTGRAALLTASLFVGALLALVGQTYQTGADTFELFLVWALAILPWALCSRLPALWVFWLVLANLAVILYFQAFQGLFGILFGPERQLWLLFGLNTLALIVWECLALRMTWLRERWALRVVATAGAVCVTTLAVIDIFDQGKLTAAVPVWLMWTGAAYAIYRRRIKDVFVLAGGVLAGIVVIASFLAHLTLRSELNAGGFLFSGLVVIGLSALGGIWLKNVANEEHSS
jgi:uncharacterized membrane protein